MAIWHFYIYSTRQVINVNKQLRSAQNWQSRQKGGQRVGKVVPFMCWLLILHKTRAIVRSQSGAPWASWQEKKSNHFCESAFECDSMPASTPFIPKGKVRSRLKEQGRIQNVQLTRSMTPVSVRGNHSYLSGYSPMGLSGDWAGQQTTRGKAAISGWQHCLYILDKEVRCLYMFERTSNGMMRDDLVIVLCCINFCICCIHINWTQLLLQAVMNP